MTTSRGISCTHFLCAPCTRLAFCHARRCPREAFVTLCCPLSTILQFSWTCDVRNSTSLVDHLWCCVSWLLLLECVSLLAVILVELFFFLFPRTITTSSPCSWLTGAARIESAKFAQKPLKSIMALLWILFVSSSHAQWLTPRQSLFYSNTAVNGGCHWEFSMPTVWTGFAGRCFGAQDQC